MINSTYERGQIDRAAECVVPLHGEMFVAPQPGHGLSPLETYVGEAIEIALDYWDDHFRELVAIRIAQQGARRQVPVHILGALPKETRAAEEVARTIRNGTVYILRDEPYEEFFDEKKYLTPLSLLNMALVYIEVEPDISNRELLREFDQVNTFVFPEVQLSMIKLARWVVKASNEEKKLH